MRNESRFISALATLAVAPARLGAVAALLFSGFTVLSFNVILLGETISVILLFVFIILFALLTLLFNYCNRHC